MSRATTTTTNALLALTAVLAACATAPKPHELESFEQIRAAQALEEARKRSPELTDESDKLFAQAQSEWQDKKLDDSRRDALMGAIKLKTALALVEQDRARARLGVAARDIAKAEDELGRATKDLNATNEQIALLQKLADAKVTNAAERQRMMAEMQAQQQKLAEEQAKLQARDKVAAAELALKNADTVEAATHAKGEYASAKDMLERAQAEFGKSQWAAAVTSAEMAKAKAEQAYSVAKPSFEAAQANQSSQARAESLNRDAAGIPGVAVRIDRRGDLQRLIIPLRDLFDKKSTALAGGQEQKLDAIANLIKKYPGYAVQVIGHTDNRGKHDQLVAVSLARAQSVSSALVSRGVDVKRVQTSGQGPDEPATDNKSAAGRAQNNRVEVVFIIQ
jgi:outer membrane protein OmpA-like peptidoglycan-associated protein